MNVAYSLGPTWVRNSKEWPIFLNLNLVWDSLGPALAESAAETTSMLLLKVWEHRFSLNDSMNKIAADVNRSHLVFDVGDLVWAYFTRDQKLVHTYNKMKAKKLGSLEVLEVNNDNAYRLKLPGYINTSDVFNVKQLSRYVPANTSSDSGSNPSNPGSPDTAASLTLAPM